MSHHDPADVRTARLSECGGLSVLLAIADGGENFLVVGEERPLAVFIDDGDWAWHSIPVDGQDHRSGLLIEGVRIEVDVTSRFDAETGIRPGALIRRGDRLSIWTTQANAPNFVGGYPHEVLGGLPDGSGAAVGFSKWRVLRGEGSWTQTILEFDLSGRK